MKMHEDECSGPGIMCVDRGVLVGTRGAQGLGQGLSVRTLSAGLVCVVLGFPLRFAAGEPRRSPTFRTCNREGSHHLPLLAGELLVGTHTAPSHIAVFAHMVPSIAPTTDSTPYSVLCITPCSLYTIHKKFYHIGSGQSEGPGHRSYSWPARDNSSKRSRPLAWSPRQKFGG